MYQAASKLGKMWKPQRSKVVSFLTHPPKKEKKKKVLQLESETPTVLSLQLKAT